MKKTIFVSLLSLSPLVVVEAATTINAQNAAGGIFAQQILLDGAAYTSGSYMIGTFTSTPTSGDLASFGWAMYGSQDFSSNAVAPGVFGVFMGAGQTSFVSGTLPTSGTGPFVGNDIFLVIANPTADEHIIWNSGLQFAAEDAVLGGAAVTFRTDNSTLVRGAFVPGGNSGLGGPLAGFNGQDAITFVPEPSVALLGAFGVLGLLRRRR